MEIRVSDVGAVDILNVEVFTALAVVVDRVDSVSLDAALAAAGAGEVAGPSQVALDPAWLRGRATTGVVWDEKFDEMVSYATARGWVRDDGFLLAHIERLHENQ